MTYSKEDIIEKLKDILIENSEEPLEEDSEIQPTDNLIALGVNSLTFISLIVKCEREFEIEFDDDELDYNVFNSLDTLADCVLEKMK